jgi:putative transposase
MKRSKFTDEQILAIAKEGGAGRKITDLSRTYGITEQTYYRWKPKYGGTRLSEMQRLKQLEDENRRLNRSSPRKPWISKRSRRSSQKKVNPFARREQWGGCSGEVRASVERVASPVSAPRPCATSVVRMR